MPGLLVDIGAVVACPHLGRVQLGPGSPRVMLNGMPAATTADLFPVVGCPFQPSPPPPPTICVRVQWLAPAVRVLVNGVPPVLNTGPALCLTAVQSPNGPATVVSAQPRVVAT